MPTESSGSSASRPRLRLQYRILLPLAVTALAALAAATWVGVRATSNALRSRLEAQVLNSVAAVTWRDFALNSAVLRNLRLVVGAHIVTLGAAGEVLASSFDGDTTPIIDAVRRAVGPASAAPASPRVVDGDCGYPCLIAFRAVEGRPGTRVALVADASSLGDATRAVVRPMLVAALVSLVVLILVGQAVVRRVTQPLERLVSFVRGLEADVGSARADVRDDEVGTLADAFNNLLDRLDQSRKALVRSEKMGLAGLMAARVAHDIRNPLSSIRLQTQLLQSSPAGDPETVDTATAILRDVDQVESVVRDLMELADPGALRLAPLSLNDVAQDVLAQLAHQLSYRKIAVVSDLHADLPLLPLDRARLRQAIRNIIVNASEAMHTGGRLVVSTRREGDGAVLRICDDGVGVDPALVDRIFDPFVSTKPEGVGLGLVNVRSVVEGHGGRVRLEPNAPRGTCAVLTFPGVNRV